MIFYMVQNEKICFSCIPIIGQYGNEYPIKGCGLIYPIVEKRWSEVSNGSSESIILDQIKVMGYRLPFYILFLSVPDSSQEVNSKNNLHGLFLKKSAQFIEAIKTYVIQ